MAASAMLISAGATILPIIGCRAAAGSATMRADFDLPESPSHVRLPDSYHRRPGFPHP
ncbi:hypothetical protein PS732_05032 [Pseudomonas fluorescens]|uniref:Lipoprotein n=1 Tax=Pseudomonas fluorescens TaxID=294 RepID=A0ABD7VMP2_PSEFL|nr:hypothetical protein PS732_05032 [Pseudomonas fluorescens]